MNAEEKMVAEIKERAEKLAIAASTAEMLTRVRQTACLCGAAVSLAGLRLIGTYEEALLEKVEAALHDFVGSSATYIQHIKKMQGE